jgi:hypothetical protein
VEKPADSSITDAAKTSEDVFKNGDKKRVKAKGLYLTATSAGSRLQHYIDLANTTEINSYVIDYKDDDGYVGYKSQIPEVKANNAWKKKYDADKVLKAFHDNGVHIIGRIVCFKDPVYSLKRPDLAIKNVAGGLWNAQDLGV